VKYQTPQLRFARQEQIRDDIAACLFIFAMADLIIFAMADLNF
jgi:hypothetical protein